MKKTFSMTIAMAALASILVVGFQNCSSGNLPNLQDQSSTAASAPTLAAVALTPSYAPSMVVNTTQSISVPNATGTPSFTQVDGTAACTVDASGLVRAASVVPTNPVCTIRVADSGSNPNLSTTISITVTTPAVVQGSQTFNPGGASTFTVPNFNTLTIEVYGGGGGGADVAYTGGSPAGGDGQDSRVTANGLALLANGGKGGGAGYIMSTATGASGAGGGASGGSSNLTGTTAPGSLGGKGAGPGGGAGGSSAQVAGAAPGGGGAGVVGATYEDNVMVGPGPSGGGGGGGGYTIMTFTPSTLPVGTVVSISVGQGGAAGALIPTMVSTGKGGDGLVKISWQ